MLVLIGQKFVKNSNATFWVIFKQCDTQCSVNHEKSKKKPSQKHSKCLNFRDFLRIFSNFCNAFNQAKWDLFGVILNNFVMKYKCSHIFFVLWSFFLSVLRCWRVEGKHQQQRKWHFIKPWKVGVRATLGSPHLKVFLESRAWFGLVNKPYFYYTKNRKLVVLIIFCLFEFSRQNETFKLSFQSLWKSLIRQVAIEIVQGPSRF